MKTLVSLALLLAAIPLDAGVNVNGSTNSCMQENTASISGTFPMSAGIWVKLANTTGTQHTLTSASAWGIASTDAADGCGAHIAFVKFGKVGVCSTITPSTSDWEFEAVTVTSTNVHFFRMTPSGTVTTQDVSDSNSFNGANGLIIGALNASCGSPVSGLVANAFEYANVGLSDTEWKSLAYLGPRALGRQPDMFFPMFFPNGSNVAMPNNDPHKNNGNAQFVYSIAVVTSASASNHCLCGDPF